MNRSPQRAVRRGLPTLLPLGALLLAAPTGAAPVNLDATAWYAQDRYTHFITPLTDANEAQYPGVTVEFRPNPGLDALVTAIAAGSAPDVITVHSSDTFPTVAAMNAMRPLDASAYKGVVPPELLAAFTRNGLLFAIPATAELTGAYVNLTLFADAGLNKPDWNWDWNDLLAIAKKLTRDTNGDGTPDIYGTSILNSEQQIGPFVFGNGGSYMDAQFNGAEVTLDSPATMAAVEYWRQLIQDYKVAVPTWEKTNFIAGTRGVLFDGSWDIGTMQSSIGTNFEWDFVADPISPTTGKRASRLATIGIGVSAETKHPDEAVHVAMLAATKGVQEAYLQNGLSPVPTRLDLFNSPYMLSPNRTPKSAARMIRETLSQGEAVPETVYPDPQMKKIVLDSINSVLRGESSTQAALTEGARQMRVLLEASANR